MDAMDPKDIIVTFHLRFDAVNFLLGKLGACPYNKVADLIAVIRQQTTAAIQQAHQAAQQGAQQSRPPWRTGTVAPSVPSSANGALDE